MSRFRRCKRCSVILISRCGDTKRVLVLPVHNKRVKPEYVKEALPLIDALFQQEEGTTQAESWGEVFQHLEEAKEGWLIVALEMGMDIPEPQPEPATP